MASLTFDILKYIIKFIQNDTDKCHYLMTCKEISKSEFYFYGLINVKKIANLLWFNHFVNIMIFDTKNILPKFVTHLKISWNFRGNINDCIPSTVTHLSFGNYFNRPIVRIPTSVTHLTLGDNFNHSLYNIIPTSVTHLTIGCWYGYSIKDCIPSSVTDLTFHDDFRECHYKDVPSTVKNLTFYPLKK